VGHPVASRPSPLARAVPGNPASNFAPSPSRVPSAHPSGERAGAGAAMTSRPVGDAITLAVPGAVCSACLGRRCSGWHPPSWKPEASPAGGCSCMTCRSEYGELPAERRTAPGAKPGAASRSCWPPPTAPPSQHVRPVAGHKTSSWKRAIG
jgi:hypothetical protein